MRDTRNRFPRVCAALIANSFFAFWAYQQADLCRKAVSHGFATGLLMLFFCLLANSLVAAWWRGHP